MKNQQKRKGMAGRKRSIGAILKKDKWSARELGEALVTYNLNEIIAFHIGINKMYTFKGYESLTNDLITEKRDNVTPTQSNYKKMLEYYCLNDYLVMLSSVKHYLDEAISLDFEMIESTCDFLLGFLSDVNTKYTDSLKLSLYKQLAFEEIKKIEISKYNAGQSFKKNGRAFYSIALEYVFKALGDVYQLEAINYFAGLELNEKAIKTRLNDINIKLERIIQLSQDLEENYRKQIEDMVKGFNFLDFNKFVLEKGNDIDTQYLCIILDELEQAHGIQAYPYELIASITNGIIEEIYF